MVKHTNNSSAFADELFECVCSFCGVGAQRVKFSGKPFSTFQRGKPEETVEFGYKWNTDKVHLPQSCRVLLRRQLTFNQHTRNS